VLEYAQKNIYSKDKVIQPYIIYDREVSVRICPEKYLPYSIIIYLR